MRRAAVLVACTFMTFIGPRASAAPGIDVFEARAEAGGIHDSIAVPAYFETFLPYSLDEASNGSAHGYHSTFYGGVFLPPPPGQDRAPHPPRAEGTPDPHRAATARAAAT